ncbi:MULTISPECIES: HlyD family secretion protein [unclassified Fusibacter]|uniref:HlyD family secretion protein n=1 Tax=unclassified Fusibacter TaxID=2624464 RepID=UPI0010105C31|nr:MULTISPECIES: efflux RND transporter periplasmic adaptor subunit [unclassified Fusibacter]MCK8060301.1 efflux RND transporter periplasmic adaptor subunit [Fusibacter sp. A2]NPE20410.1 HlyD family efflux transporter periplasmic adaptor subunit [Fusibacter sp. A1]RXV63615.1 HlyD family efflux transporter periplasmic adaptor subunit [Fusibacter sp. A1]
MKKAIFMGLSLIVSMSLVACSAQAVKVEDQEMPEVIQDQHIEVYGKVVAGETKVITLNQSFMIEETNAKVGTSLKKGDNLITFNPSDIMAQKNLLEMQIASLSRQIEKGDLGYSQANHSYASTKAEVDAAQETYEKNLKLYGANAISESELKQSKDQLDTAKRQLEASGLSVTSALSTSTTQTEALALDLKRSQNQLDQILQLLNNPFVNNGEIVCAFDHAIVSEVHVQSGTYYSSFSPLLELINQEKLLVRATVSEEYMNSISLEQNVEVSILAYPDMQFQGQITFISAKAEFEGGETVIPIEITLEDTMDLMPNMNADIKIPVQ